jgi:peptidoglycan hydrolase-like protein with peptidoglycan-binding domain
MKIKKSELEKIIAEEIEKMLDEQGFFSGPVQAIGGAMTGQPPAGGFSGMLPKAQRAMAIDRATALQNKLLQGIASLQDAKNLQKVLNDAGFNAGKPDGRVGGNTIRAIKALQKALGVKPDGKYGKNTHAAWKKLGFAKKANFPEALKRAAIAARMSGDEKALDMARRAHVAAGGKLEKGKAVKGPSAVTAAYPK